MHTDIETRRRVLNLMYQRYLEADRHWTLAAREVRTWFPMEYQPNLSRLGNPESSIRRLYEQREKALFRLKAAQMKLVSAKQRLAKTYIKRNSAPLLYITYTGTVVKNR